MFSSLSFPDPNPTRFTRLHLLRFARRAPANVAPLVVKGLAQLQWKQDINGAERCCDEALRIDPECELAVATLAQLNLQQGKIAKAVEMFDKQVQLARNEPQLNNALTYKRISRRWLLSSTNLHMECFEHGL
jgi:import receptor subunit TOM70